MMFFLIAGIQPKTVDLEDRPGLCPNCGLQGTRRKRVDHYLSVFFLPVLRVKKGVPFLLCPNCDIPSGYPGESRPGGPEPVCAHCGAALDRSFRFCPSCGRPVS